MRKNVDGLDYADLMLVGAYLMLAQWDIQPEKAKIEVKEKIRAYLVEQGLVELTPDGHYRLN